MTTAHDDRPMVHIRLSKPLLKQVDHLGVEWELDRARTVEKLLAIAVRDVKEQQE